MALSDPTQIHFSRNHTPPGHYRVHRSGLFVVCELNKTKKILRRAAIDGYYYMKEGYIAGVPGEMVWGTKRTWRDVFFTDPDGGFSWDTVGMLDYDNRVAQTKRFLLRKGATDPDCTPLTTGCNCVGYRHALRGARHNSGKSSYLSDLLYTRRLKIPIKKPARSR
jgi:hypothetical protein